MAAKVYIDSYLMPVKKSGLAHYRKFAALSAKVWMELGALSYMEAMADDTPWGKLTSFPRAVKLKDDEVLVIGMATFKSRKDRDRINKAAMQDKRFIKLMEPGKFPADGKRMIWGGFKEFVRG